MAGDTAVILTAMTQKTPTTPDRTRIPAAPRLLRPAEPVETLRRMLRTPAKVPALQPARAAAAVQDRLHQNPQRRPAPARPAPAFRRAAALPPPPPPPPAPTS